MNTKQIESYENTQIIRKDGNNCFVEVKSFSFPIGKVQLFFASYDTSRPEGDRFTSKVDAYIDIPTFLQWANEVKNGSLHRKMHEKKQLLSIKEPSNEQKKKMWEPLLSSIGGTPANKLKEPRKDKMSLSRIIKLTAASKADYLLTAESGPGQENEKGLIVPRYELKPENKVIIPLTWRGLEELFLAVETHYQAWLAAQYMRAG